MEIGESLLSLNDELYKLGTVTNSAYGRKGW